MSGRIQPDWVAGLLRNTQFCRHFLAPLVLAGKVRPELLRLAAVFPDGIPLPVAGDVLGFRGWLNASILVHLHLHAKAEARFARWASPSGRAISERQILDTLEGLRDAIESVKITPKPTQWTTYDPKTFYSVEAWSEKERFVDEAVHRIRPQSLWDIGAHRGTLAIRHAPASGFALAIEADLASVSTAYREAKAARMSVAALWIDILAPTPPTAGDDERASLTERGPADLVLLLATLHHICLTGGIPLPKVVDWLTRICVHAVVEVVDRSDPMLETIANFAPLQAERFGCAEFRKSIQGRFRILREQQLTGLARTVFLLRRESVAA